MADIRKNIFYVMGVSGCGKSTIGLMLAEKLGLPFYDGDDYHPDDNIRKMREGIPLTDADRKDWLKRLNQLAVENIDSGAVIVCSALKASYRDILSRNISGRAVFISLEGPFELIMERIKKRRGHFMPPELLQSQFDAFEPPEDALRISIEKKTEDILSEIMETLSTPD